MQAQGRYDLIARSLDDPRTRRLYGRNDRLLWLLDRGAAALALRDHATAIDLLNQAEDFMDIRHGASAADAAAQWLLNDTAAEYLGEPYESIYVNDLKLLAQLERGALLGGATVEARRAATKANRLRDLYVVYRRAVDREAPPEIRADLDAAAPSVPLGSGRPLVAAGTGGQFIESPLATFLTAVTFMVTGERGHQAVAGRRLLDSIRLQGHLIGPVRAEAFEGLGERAPTDRDLLVVAISGQAPTKHAERFGPIPIYQWPVYYEIPVLRGGSAEAAAARVVLAPAVSEAEPPAADPSTAFTYDLPLVEDMRSVATENHNRQLPAIQARAILRSTAKAAAAFAASQAVTDRGRKQGWTNLAAILGGLALVTLTERADLRCWVLLPGQAHAGLFHMPPGDHWARVEYLGPGGGLLYATPWRMIRETDYAPGEAGARLATIVEHFGR